MYIFIHILTHIYSYSYPINIKIIHQNQRKFEQYSKYRIYLHFLLNSCCIPIITNYITIIIIKNISNFNLIFIFYFK